MDAPRSKVHPLEYSPGMSHKPMVLVVEDNDAMRKLLFAELTGDGRFTVEQAATGKEGIEKAVSSECNAIVLDMMLPDTDGLQFIEQLRIKRPDCPPVIAITGAATSALPDGVLEGPYRGFDRAKLRDT